MQISLVRFLMLVTFGTTFCKPLVLIYQQGVQIHLKSCSEYSRVKARMSCECSFLKRIALAAATTSELFGATCWILSDEKLVSVKGFSSLHIDVTNNLPKKVLLKCCIHIPYRLKVRPPKVTKLWPNDEIKCRRTLSR